MTPITRKENYLNEIVGWGETAPEKPLTPEEFFFAAILGEAVQTPEPLSRYQIYLAKIAGRNISVPKPLTRLELFLAKACGMDIETPTPITREEIFWSNYSAIVDFEVEGVPPLTYKAIEGTLENYRIYGNTVGGESVGDRTGNLFDGFSVHGMVPSVSTGELTNSPSGGATIDFIAIDNGDITLSKSNAAQSNMYIFLYAQDKSYIGYNQTTAADTLILYGNSINGYQNAKYARIRVDVESAYTQTNIMLNEGSTALPYEPYGYKVPVTISNDTDTLTTPIYLPEQIKMVGDEAEYIDYAEQKQHRVRKNLFDEKYENILENLPTYEAIYVGDGYFTLSTTAPLNANSAASLFLMSGDVQTGASTATTGVWTGHKGIVESVNGYITVAYRYQSGVDPRDYNTMLNEGSTALPYEPYIENTDLDVNLPELPTLAGTNVLTVGTAVQPSKVYVQGEKEREYS